MRALSITAGQARWVDVDNTLEALQAQVRGYLESIPLNASTVALVNEEGRYNGMGRNAAATLFVSARRLEVCLPPPVGDIVGPCLIVGIDGTGEFTDVPASEDRAVAALQRALA